MAKIDPGLKGGDIRPAFNSFNRVHIPGFLTPDSAATLYETLVAETLWVCSTISGGKNADIPVETLEALTPEQYRQFMAVAHTETSSGLHFMFDTVRISTDIENGSPVRPVYRALHEMLNSEAFLGFVREATGDDRPLYVDSQATRFQPGHYLNQHNDAHDRRQRLYAYVLSLTPDWRADWGGLLAFIDDDGHVSETYTPRFNALNLFTVPYEHAVTYVAPFAGGNRLSVTGWIRQDKPVSAA